MKLTTPSKSSTRQLYTHGSSILIHQKYNTLPYHASSYMALNKYDETYCDIMAQVLIGLIEYSYYQDIHSFLKLHLQRILGLGVLDPK
jgi:hypothetical protein